MVSRIECQTFIGSLRSCSREMESGGHSCSSREFSVNLFYLTIMVYDHGSEEKTSTVVLPNQELARKYQHWSFTGMSEQALNLQLHGH